MHRSIYLVLLTVLASLALVLAAPAAADAPEHATSTVTLGPFVDDETCAFEITTTVERTRTTLTFANGDIQRHARLIVSSTANGRSVVERDAFNIFIDSDSPDAWVITGAWTHARPLGGGTIALQSGRLVYDVLTDAIVDPHSGPHPDTVDGLLCAALAA